MLAYLALCAALVAGLRAFSAEESSQTAALAAVAQARSFGLPGECPPQALPCVMGLRPGVTRASEAYAVLFDHPWVANLDLYVDFNALVWSWSGQQPDWVDSSVEGVVSLYQNIVSYVRVKTRLRLGDAAILDPAHFRRAVVRGMSSNYVAPFVLVDADDPARTLYVEAVLSCQVGLAAFWRAPIRLNAMSDLEPRLSPSITADWAGERRLCAGEEWD
jgi:hypothetical protein